MPMTDEHHRSNRVCLPSQTKLLSPGPPRKHEPRAHDSDVTWRTKIRLQTGPRSQSSPPSPRESFSGRIVLLKVVFHETGTVSSTITSSTPLLVSERGLPKARDDTLQVGAHTTVYALSILHTASHGTTLSALSASDSALASSYTQ
jgi:hypothetical protein